MKLQIRNYLLLIYFVGVLMNMNAQNKINYSDSIVLLDVKLQKRIQKNVLRIDDTTNIYVGDGNQQDLYYQSLIPSNPVKGVIVLFPGTWETTEHTWNSMAEFTKIAFKNDLAVIVLSINQRLTLTDEIFSVINTMCEHAISKYHLPQNNFVFGGFSMGGLFSLRYTEMAIADSTKAKIKPKAVFSCDGPIDLKHVYLNFQRKKDKNPGMNEPKYGIAELELYCHGTPTTNQSLYDYYSCYSNDLIDGGNAQFLINIPVRIYADVDPIWWMQNRHVDMYDLNALDQTAMIQLLNDKGNLKAEFINSYQQGFRIEGNRHPHSWSIVEPKSCIDWILKNLN